MNRITLSLALSIPCCLVSVLGLDCPASEPDALQFTTEREAKGEIVDRRLPRGSQPSSDVAGWISGMLKTDDGWKNIDELTSGKLDEEYLKTRMENSGNPNMHLALARWCVRHQMLDQARAHYFAALATDANNREARNFLGHVQMGVNWIDKNALATEQRTLRLRFEQMEESVQKLVPIVEDMQSGVAKRMTAAFQKLDNLKAEAALPGLELFASNLEDDMARPLIRKIASVRSEAACLTLVRVALAHPSDRIRQQTCEAIREYPEHYYVPDLLGMLATEAKITGNLVMYPNGRISIETLVSNELQNRKQLHRAQKLVSVVAKFSSSHSVNLQTQTFGDISYWSNFWQVPIDTPAHYGAVKGSKGTNLANASYHASYVPRNVALVAARNMLEQGKLQELEVAQANRELRERTNNVCSLLRSTTGASVPDEAQAWWSWWNDRNERYEGDKPTAVSYNHQQERIGIGTRSYANHLGENAYDFGKMLIQYSCLVPGSMVQTSTGLVAIEEIQVGDLVLSQDVETAELALKPVILTTVRPPKSTIEIVTKNETIKATGGHFWFVPGKGWLKTRDLEPGMTLHTATGAVAVEKLVVDPTEQKTYNLVVDDFHTYFVGEQRVLSYDNTLLNPTLQPTPGYEAIASSDL